MPNGRFERLVATRLAFAGDKILALAHTKSCKEVTEWNCESGTQRLVASTDKGRTFSDISSSLPFDPSKELLEQFPGQQLVVVGDKIVYSMFGKLAISRDGGKTFSVKTFAPQLVDGSEAIRPDIVYLDYLLEKDGTYVLTNGFYFVDMATL